MGKETVNTSGAPAAIGPYSQAVRVGQFLFASGQLGLDPVSGELREGIEAQTRQALANLQAVLAAAGATVKDVVKTTIFLVDMADFAIVNRIYAEVFKEEPPARSTVQVAALPKNGLVEIEMIVWVGD
ncbi:MAG: RidA family protein [Caldilinea sp.]|nr:RidA family protein [Caldilinea sp.]MDW8440110.1 RidA family protein [Caldilineaceae bacterium]